MLHRYLTHGILIGALGLLPLLGLAQGAAEVGTLVEQGTTLHDAGRFEEAVAKYQQALQLEPGSVLARTELALTYMSLERYAEAAKLCEALLATPSQASPTVYTIYGNALDSQKKTKEAIKVYEQGLKRFPEHGMLHFNLGIAQYKLQKPEEAQASFQRAAQLAPKHASSHLLLGLLTADAGNRIPAILEIARFLVLEQQGKRAASNLKRLDQLLQRGVTKTGDNSVTISMSEDMLKDMKKDKGDDNFASLDMTLTLTGALDHSEKSKGKTPMELFVDKMTIICQSLGEKIDKSGKSSPKGFAWQYYAPYFALLERTGHLPAFAHLIRSADPEQADVQQWLSQHRTEVQAFQEWSAAYVWPK